MTKRNETRDLSYGCRFYGPITRTLVFHKPLSSSRGQGFSFSSTPFPSSMPFCLAMRMIETRDGKTERKRERERLSCDADCLTFSSNLDDRRRRFYWIFFFLFFFLLKSNEVWKRCRTILRFYEHRGGEFITLMEFIARLSFEEHV